MDKSCLIMICLKNCVKINKNTIKKLSKKEYHKKWSFEDIINQNNHTAKLSSSHLNNISYPEVKGHSNIERNLYHWFDPETLAAYDLKL